MFERFILDENLYSIRVFKYPRIGTLKIKSSQSLFYLVNIMPFNLNLDFLILRGKFLNHPDRNLAILK